MEVLGISYEASRQKKFFVIEDDPDHQKIAEMALHSAGINDITFFSTGEDAMDYFTERSPSASPDSQVILIDLMLPKISGLEILQRLRRDSRWQSSVMIVLTCSTNLEDRKRSQEYGADDFLSKPLRLENVQKILTAIS